MTTTRRVENYGGLRRAPQLEEMVNYLANHQERTKFPDREAKQIRNHPFMTQLDFFDTNEEQKRAWEEEKRKHEIKEIASQMKSSEALERAKRTRSTGHSAIVDPKTGGRDPDGNVQPCGKSIGQARDEYDEEVRMKRDNPKVWLEYDAESQSLKTDRENKSELTTQTVRFALRQQAIQPDVDYPVGSLQIGNRDKQPNVKKQQT